MAATKEEINAWLKTGQERQSTHVIIAVDTFDYQDYPVYIAKKDDVQEKLKNIRNGQDRAMEVYNLSLALDPQLNQPRAWNI